MNFLLFTLIVWWLCGLLGFRKRRPRRRHRSTGYWRPHPDPFDYEEHLRRNAK